MTSFKRYTRYTAPSAAPERSISKHPKNHKKKSVLIDTSQNKVRLIRVPPRSRNSDYWFTETERILKKGVQFEVEPDINTAVNVDCRMQLCTLSMSASAASPRQTHSVVSLLSEDGPLFSAGSPPFWQSVGWVRSGEMVAVRVILPPGSYQIRCEGKHPVQIFAQVWDIERELI